VRTLESNLSEYCNKKYAVCCSSGTAALYLAFRCIPARRMRCTPVTFRATTWAARLAGHQITYWDIDPNCFCAPTPDINVHLAGYVSKSTGLVEDASHALGSTRMGLAAFTCISLHAIKHLGVGEGGVVLTDDADDAGRLRELREFGTEEAPSLNFRMAEVPAALGVSRLSRVGQEKAQKKELMFRYRKELDGLVKFQRDQESMNPHLCIICTDRAEKLAADLAAEGIGTAKHYQPLDKLGNAQSYWERCLSLPLYADMSETEQGEVIETTKRSLG
jgi:dTDP-4-amino-4,6-dideoxygalactose transaminase